MAKFNKGLSSCLMAVMMVCCTITGAVKASVYTVGDSSGWSMSGDYTTWATDKTFAVGDTLLFNYSPGHTVDEVSEADYKSCTTGNAIASDSSGATSITLKTPGDHYFICGVSGHCTGGMKLAVNTATAAVAPSTGSRAPVSSPGSTLPPASSPPTGTTTLPPTDATATLLPTDATTSPATVTTTSTPFAPPTAIRTSPTGTASSPSAATTSSPVAMFFAICGVMMIHHFLH